MASQYVDLPVTGGGSSGVSSLNALTGALTIVAGTGISVTPSGSNITIANTGAGAGTVTSVSVVSANGFSGSVANQTTTPAITLTTSITGILQGNGTAISAATTGNLTDVGTDGITVTGGTGAVLGSGTSISQHVADTTHNGYLSSSDWNTFNGKQAAGNYITALTGDVTASGPGSVASTLATVNTNVGSFGSSTAIPSFTVNGKGLITAASTNVVVAPAGTLTGTTLASNVVTSSLTSVGTITSGTWTGTSIAIANGGTGQTAANAAFNALSPLTTKGDLIGFSTVNARLPVGTDGQLLSADSTQTTGLKWITSGGTGTVTSVAMTVPSFLSVSGSPITTTGTLAVSLSGTALPVANGGTGVTSVTVSPAATAFAGWDANKNLSANNFLQGYATTATAAGTTTLTVSSTEQQFFTGSTTQTVLLPVASTLVLGQKYIITNLSSGVVTVQSSGANSIQAMAANSQLTLVCILTSGTTAASWSATYQTLSAGGTGTVTSVAMTVPSFLSVSGSPITTTGTLAISLSGTALPIANGGTGQTSASAAFNALSPMTTGGDVIYGGASGAGTRLANGSLGQVLTSAGGTSAPTWSYPSSTTISKTANYTLINSDDLVIADTSGGVFTLTLPTAVGITGKRFTIKLKTAGSILTIATTSAQTIDGLSSYKMGTKNDELQVESDGANWVVIIFGIASLASYTGSPPTGTLTNSYNNVTFGTKVTDTLSQYSGATFTAIYPGTYLVSANLSYFGTYSLGGSSYTVVAVNGVQLAEGGVISQSTTTPEMLPGVGYTCKVNAGDTINIQSWTNGVSPSFNSFSQDNFFSICRIGN